MSNTRKIAIGLGIAGGAILAAWLFTGDRKKKTKEFIAKKTQSLKGSLKDSLKGSAESFKKEQELRDDDVHYV